MDVVQPVEAGSLAGRAHQEIRLWSRLGERDVAVGVSKVGVDEVFGGSDRKLVIIGLLIFCIPSVAFAYSDFLLFGYTQPFYYLIFVRSFVILLAFFTIYLVAKTKNLRAQDWLLFSTVMLVVCSIFYINLGRPTDYFHHSSTDILAVFALYWIIPNRYYLQVIPAITMSLFNIYIFLFIKDSTSSLVNINF